MSSVYHSWNYFISLENDLLNLTRYIEFNKDNFSVYSIELEKILFLTCSEFENTVKSLGLLKGENKLSTISEMFRFLSQHYKNIFSLEVTIERYKLTLMPFKEWNENQEYTPLSWWKGYNDVKHNRISSFNCANLENVLTSMSALLVLNYHYYQVLITQEDQSQDEKEMTTITKILRPKTQLLEVKSRLYYEVPYNSPY